jgi:hypothetical protein
MVLLVTIIYIASLGFGIFLIILGAKKKGLKGQRSGWGMTSFIAGIIFTSMLALYIIIPMTEGIYDAISSGSITKAVQEKDLRNQAIAKITIAKRIRDIKMVNQAITKINEALKISPEKSLADKDLEVLKEAKALKHAIEKGN